MRPLVSQGPVSQKRIGAATETMEATNQRLLSELPMTAHRAPSLRRRLSDIDQWTVGTFGDGSKSGRPGCNVGPSLSRVRPSARNGG